MDRQLSLVNESGEYTESKDKAGKNRMRKKHEDKCSQFPERANHGDVSSPWRLFDGRIVHKIFVWDGQGQYVDCQFPNPVYGHFLGGSSLKGKHVRDVLPPSAARIIQQGIAWALKFQEPCRKQFPLSGDTRKFLVHIHLVPIGERVLGLVSDSELVEQKTSKSPNSDINLEKALSDRADCLSKREWAIVMAIKSGLNNQAIARNFQISERTVKFHLANIYRKLRISSRFQLLTLIPMVSPPPSVNVITLLNVT